MNQRASSPSLPNEALWRGLPDWLMQAFGAGISNDGNFLIWLGGLALLAAVGGFVVALADFNALFICIALSACVFIFTNFRIGVALLIVVMPISASYLFPHNIAGITGLNPLNLLLIGTLCAWNLQQTAGQAQLKQLMPAPLRWWYLLPMVIAGLIGFPHVGEIPAEFYALTLTSFDTAGGYLRDLLAKPLLTVLFAVLVGAAVARSKSGEDFLIPMVISIWLMALMTIFFVLMSGISLSDLAGWQSREFFAPLGMHANDLGRCYAIAYALLLFPFAESTNYRLRMILLITMSMVVIALIFTFSRGAFLGFIVVNILFLLSRRKFTTLMLGILVFSGIIFLLPDAVFDRLGTGWGSGLNAMSAGRVDNIWLPLLPELRDSPIWGNGLYSILWSDAMRTGSILRVTTPHNAYLQAALDMGFVGLILLCAYFAHVWRGFRSLGKDTALSPVQRAFYEGAAVGLLSFLLAAFVGSSLTPVPEQSFLWLAIGMMYGEQARKAEK